MTNLMREYEGMIMLPQLRTILKTIPTHELPVGSAKAVVGPTLYVSFSLFLPASFLSFPLVSIPRARLPKHPACSLHSSLLPGEPHLQRSGLPVSVRWVTAPKYLESFVMRLRRECGCHHSDFGSATLILCFCPPEL